MRLTRAHLVLFAIVTAVLVTASWPHAQTLQKVTINYPTRSGASWHLYIAKEGGYYQKYGLDVDPQFGVTRRACDAHERPGRDGATTPRAGHDRRHARCPNAFT
jgi:ABC-type nitrate/sulfonate/bicarbonate transport system substrate-binding protein